jgi:Fic/DOC family
MLVIKAAKRTLRMTPGAWRTDSEHDVAVGRHVPPSSAHIADFMLYFEERFKFDKMGRAAQIMAMASAHQRFNYIHPFSDGNGRVSRLMSHAMAVSPDLMDQALMLADVSPPILVECRGKRQRETYTRAKPQPKRCSLRVVRQRCRYDKPFAAACEAASAQGPDPRYVNAKCLQFDLPSVRRKRAYHMCQTVQRQRAHRHRMSPFLLFGLSGCRRRSR